MLMRLECFIRFEIALSCTFRFRKWHTMNIQFTLHFESSQSVSHPTNTHLKFCPNRRKIRFRYRSQPTSWSLLDSGKRIGRVRHQEDPAARYLEVRQRTLPAIVSNAHVRQRTSPRSGKSMSSSIYHLTVMTVNYHRILLANVSQHATHTY